ncbi:MarR family winged helix-turn-helix transcriptional regulator [Paenibacillus sp. XY044]|uniref:MarR family winged helix-turn-helix transcriptional regulator n=1 Tax=Paenibacillus sp. XY044 TaxID=2026089 RepID=UPI000B990F06|nr:MarR family transcriptional regulator [Paenibacillus sp. XY044]OZB96697.1 hypothetical protein CJP46_12595 [Paenibacillus sp. XY044]
MNPDNSRLAAAYIQLIPLLHRGFDMPSARKTLPELTHLQYHVLEALYHQPVSYSMGLLAKSMHISKQQLTPLIAKLEEKECLTKHPDPQDKRQIGLSLTEKGRRIVSSRWESFHRELSHQLDRLSEEDLSDLGFCLEKMTRILRRLDPDTAKQD